MPLYQFDMRPKVTKYVIIDPHTDSPNCFFCALSNPRIDGENSWSYWVKGDGAIRYFDTYEEAAIEARLIPLVCHCDRHKVLAVQPAQVSA